MLTDERRMELSDILRPVAQSRDVAFLLNDRADLAVQTGCDGAHLGQGDGDHARARKLLGAELMLGITCHGSRHLAMQAGDTGQPSQALHYAQVQVRAFLALSALVRGQATNEERALAEAMLKEPGWVAEEALAAWGLAVDAYHRGDAETARSLMARLDRIAPHCPPLRQMVVPVAAAG